MISVVDDTLDGTGVVDLESLPVIETDSRDALPPAVEVVEKVASVDDPGKGCAVISVGE
jgi:hypothetical protein